MVQKKWEYCGNCGYELFPLDTVCDRCGTKCESFQVDENNNLKIKKKTSSKEDNKKTSEKAQKASSVNKAAAKDNSKSNPVPTVANAKTSYQKSTGSLPVTTPDGEEKKNNNTKLILYIVGGIFVFLFVVGIIIFGVYKVKSQNGETLFSGSEAGASTNKKKSFVSEVTIPCEYVDELGITEFYFEDIIGLGAAESAEYNDDGSVTIKFNKTQYKIARKLVKESLNKMIKENVEYGYYTDVTKIETDSELVKFKVYTETDDVDMYDEYLSDDLFLYANIYASLANEKCESIQIELYESSSKKKYHSFEYKGEPLEYEDEYYEDEYSDEEYEDEYYEDEYSDEEYYEDEEYVEEEEYPDQEDYFEEEEIEEEPEEEIEEAIEEETEETEENWEENWEDMEDEFTSM